MHAVDPIISPSSGLISSLIETMYPSGAWFLGRRTLGLSFLGAAYKRNLVAKVALSCIAATACVETALFGGLAFTSKLFFPKSTTTLREMRISSCFAIRWALTGIMRYDLVFCDVHYSHESFARRKLFPSFYREQDRAYCDRKRRWADALPEEVEEGGFFLVDYVLAENSGDDEERLKSFDSSLATYAVTKAIWVYVCGIKRNDPVLEIFKETTRTEIEKLRKEFDKNEFAGMFATEKLFNEGMEDNVVRSRLNKLRSVAFGELQGGRFVTTCWGAVCGHGRRVYRVEDYGLRVGAPAVPLVERRDLRA